MDLRMESSKAWANMSAADLADIGRSVAQSHVR